VLLPLVNVPMIEYTLSWLESAGVEECFVFCCAHAQQVKEHLGKAGWTGKPAAREMTVTAVESHDAISAGDALRVMYGRGVIHGDFVLISGDTISNMNLKDALQEHKDRRKKDPLAVMTMVIKHSKPSILTNQTRLGNDEIVMAIDPETKELLYYEDRADVSNLYVTIDKDILASNPTLQLHNNMEVCF
jgi:translation initiation factor eIF-2B subunit epsilon